MDGELVGGCCGTSSADGSAVRTGWAGKGGVVGSEKARASGGKSDGAGGGEGTSGGVGTIGGVLSEVMVAVCDGGDDVISYVTSIIGGWPTPVAESGGEAGETSLGEGGAEKA
jgi:hypothetical protein